MENLKVKELAKSKELIDTLSCEVGQNWFGSYAQKELKPTLVNALNYLNQFTSYYLNNSSNSIFFSNDHISERLFTNSITTLEHINNKDYKSAYHDLWDCIDNMGKGSEKDSVINHSEFIIFKSLIQYFIKSLS
ncbi:MAG: hypothetical protein RSB38_00235 [Oscillospiraceae bacterium]